MKARIVAVRMHHFRTIGEISSTWVEDRVMMYLFSLGSTEYHFIGVF